MASFNIKHKLGFADDYTYADDPLLCPGCGECYLHQSHVEILFRKEDEDFGLVANVSWDGVQTSRDVSTFSGGIGRRDVIHIYFSCEQCNPHGCPDEWPDDSESDRESKEGNDKEAEKGMDEESADEESVDEESVDKEIHKKCKRIYRKSDYYYTLVIGQHKGCTYIGWQKRPRKI